MKANKSATPNRTAAAERRAPQPKTANTILRRRAQPVGGVWFIAREAESGKFLLRFKLPVNLAAKLRRVARELDQTLTDMICNAIDFHLRYSKTAPEGQGRDAV